MRYDESFFFSTSSPPQPLLQGLQAAHAQVVALREKFVQVQIAAVVEGVSSHKHSGTLIASHRTSYSLDRVSGRPLWECSFLGFPHFAQNKTRQDRRDRQADTHISK
jgi:hypothetical protein